MEEKRLLLLSSVLIAIIVLVAIGSALSLKPAPSTGYVALIKLEGVLAYRTSQITIFGMPTDAEDLLNLLHKAESDPNAKAVVLFVDSPGGEAAASEALYLKIRKLAASKPVVAFVRGYGTSGAYMAILPSRRIVAANSSIVGSVRVYVSVITYRGLLEKLGIKAYVYKSGELKDIGSPFREPTEEDKRVLQGIVDGIFKLFKERVMAHRNITDEEVFSGRPFTAEEALKAGLIDEIGAPSDAINLARRLAGLPEDAPVHELKPPRPSLLQLLLEGTLMREQPVVPSIEILTMWPPPAGL